ncbi:MAG: hypothetical protein QOE85_2043 [Actinomycetota bacterium]|nr:hypothetical protein [Actinomycetota bacterium]
MENFRLRLNRAHLSRDRDPAESPLDPDPLQLGSLGHACPVCHDGHGETPRIGSRKHARNVVVQPVTLALEALMNPHREVDERAIIGSTLEKGAVPGFRRDVGRRYGPAHPLVADFRPVFRPGAIVCETQRLSWNARPLGNHDARRIEARLDVVLLEKGSVEVEEQRVDHGSCIRKACVRYGIVQ